jgi:putative hydrolase of the HAD superfamily
VSPLSAGFDRTGRIEAVTFDYWQTLMGEQPGHLSGLRRAAWSRVLAEAGHDVPEDVLREAFEQAWFAYEANWIAGTQYLAPQAANDLIERLGLAITETTRDALIEAFVETGRDGELEPAPGLATALDALKAADVRIGIVCDVGMTGSPILIVHLERHGLLEFFDHWSFSDVVGFYKPDARIFEHALLGLGGVDPARAAHVGDRLRTDVAGARAVGMTSVRYTGLHDDHADGFKEADHVIGDHRDLVAALELM